MKNRKITVVIPTFNHADYLLEAYQSSKKAGFNCEVIIVNDGSSDDTEKVLEKLQDVVVINQKNKGAAITLNTAIQLVSTEYVSILNDDDLYLESHLETVCNALDSTNSDLVIARPTIFGSGEKYNQLKRFADQQDEIIEKRGVFWSLFEFNWSLSTSAYAFRKEFWNRGIRFKDYRLCHDLDFILSAIVEYSAVVSVLKQPTWSYRCHDNNSGSKVSEEDRLAEVSQCLVENLLKVKNVDFRSIVDDFIGYDLPKDYVYQILNECLERNSPKKK